MTTSNSNIINRSTHHIYLAAQYGVPKNPHDHLQDHSRYSSIPTTHSSHRDNRQSITACSHKFFFYSKSRSTQHSPTKQLPLLNQFQTLHMMFQPSTIALAFLSVYSPSQVSVKAHGYTTVRSPTGCLFCDMIMVPIQPLHVSILLLTFISLSIYIVEPPLAQLLCPRHHWHL